MESLSHDNSISDWQFKQAINAIKLLLKDLSNIPAAQEMDWNYWQLASKTLEPSHATIAANKTIDEILNIKHQA